MSERNSSLPPDVTSLAPAIYEVARRIIAAEESPGGVYSSATTEPPLLEATPPYLGIISGAELDSAAALVFRILVAAELDRNVHRVLRRLSAIPEATGTPVDGVVAVVEGLGEDPVAALRALWPGAPLLARGVVHSIDASVPPISQQVTVRTRILDHLLTGEVPPPAAPFVIEPAVPAASLCPIPVRGTNIDATTFLRRLLANPSRRSQIWVVGPPGSGRRTLLAAVAAEQGKRLICVSQAALAAMPPGTVVAAIWRELLLSDGLVCIHDAEPVVDTGSPEAQVRTASIDRSFVSFADTLMSWRIPVVFTSNQAPPVQAFDVPPHVVQLDPPRPEDTLALWRRGLPEVPEVVDLATRFRMPPGRVVRAIAAARMQQVTAGTPALTSADVSRAISLGVEQQVSILGNRVQDSQTWDDIVLPPDTRDSIYEMVARVRHRHHVLEEWGFRGKLAKGIGVAALFHGPPGTGKTMVASLIARELGQELYQVDISRMVSKWIGETEKNLAKVFDAAEGANVMLLFDEADSLFSKRTAVTTSNDRHANAEVNYLLQRVERFEGVCILTTNFERSIDTAFKRRLAFRIEFPMPNEKERTELWRRMVPRTANIARDVDFAKLATSYELAGGNIRNALLRAAFLAADRGEPITMATLQFAVKLEYRDAGKLAATGAIT
ncbi:MAG: AAA family ATPase [Myxococcales bacterium]|nr:AAA family ATPase [Myxococcales bacterium]